MYAASANHGKAVGTADASVLLLGDLPRRGIASAQRDAATRLDQLGHEKRRE